MKVGSTHAARELLERKPGLMAESVSSLLIGATEFFREPGVFDFLQTKVLPEWVGRRRPLRIWSAACSTGAELYSMAILLGETGLLEQSYLLGTDCRGDAIECAESGLYDAATLKCVPRWMRDRYFEPVRPMQQRSGHRAPCLLHGRCAGPAPGECGLTYRPIEALRRQAYWKVADLLAGVGHGPWDILLWRNAAIYLTSRSAETIWRRLVSVLVPGGVLIAGKADRPPCDAGLTHVARCVYRVADGPATAVAGSKRQSPLPRSIGRKLVPEPFL